MKVTNWGMYPTAEAEVRSFGTVSEAAQSMQDWQEMIPRGLGRCYGDSSLNTNILSTLKFNRFLDFDRENGLLTCQSGVSLREMLDVIVPAGWFLPVTPGTKFVTLGGAIAADVHGKNHHSEGSFSAHLERFSLLAPGGQIYECSRTQNADIFWATCGGQGLTGLILEGTFRLKKIETAYIKEESIKAKNVHELFKLFESSMQFTYSVAWIDCLAKGSNLGRAILLNGEHAGIADLTKDAQRKAPLVLPKKGKIAVPVKLPFSLINPLTVKVFNGLYYAKAKGGRHEHIVDYDTYFYPLDSVLHWNRVYGKPGFAQYQFALPPAVSYDGMVKMLELIAEERFPSFVSVLKYFGKGETGPIAFPMEGYMLAMDFPITNRLFPFLDRLDQIVADAGGRIYLTKDSRMKPEIFQKGYPRLPEFLATKAKIDAGKSMQSLQSKRLGV